MLESDGMNSKPTGYVQIIYLILFLLNVAELSKFWRMKASLLLLQGTTLVLPLQWRLFPFFFVADAVPASSNTDAVPAFSAVDAVPAPTHDLDLEDIHPQGSSRATGRILRGHAAASYYSPADEEKTMFNAIGAVKLTAKIFTSNLDPVNLNHDNMVPSSKVTIKMNPNLGPILNNISKRYPAIKGIYCYKI